MQQIPQAATRTGQRRKLWEIPSAYHCSIIGTCLSLDDMETLRKKLGNDLQQTVSTYQLHALLVDLAGAQTPAATLLNNFLNKKYKTAVARYARLRDDEAVERQWRNDLFRGAMRGPYWAMMTHPSPSAVLLSTVYGHLHMLGYESLFLTVGYRVKLRDHQDKIKDLEHAMRHLRLGGKEREETLRAEVIVLRNQVKAGCRLLAENDRLRGEIEALRLSDVQAAWQQERNELSRSLAEADRRTAGLEQRIKELAERLWEEESLLQLADRTIRELEWLGRPVGEASDCPPAGHAISADQSGQQCPCCPMECEAEMAGLCPGPALCGKNILYVGGLHTLIPRYRELVEGCGGHFLYHDGGTETSRQRLPQLISQADAVCCPVDCVSHLACTCVKKLCKRQKKPFVMMRSAGLSHLAGSLEKISGPGRRLPPSDRLAPTHV